MFIMSNSTAGERETSVVGRRERVRGAEQAEADHGHLHAPRGVAHRRALPRDAGRATGSELVKYSGAPERASEKVSI